MGSLYLVATPIGNLEDISRRAIRILSEVGLVAAEDTRRTRKLLNAYDIKKPIVSYHEHNKLARLDYILDSLKGGDVALVSDAGTPAMSDPGYELVSAAIGRGVPVVPVPGPSVIITALVVSGLPTRRFIYLGFLPRRAGERRRALESVGMETGAIVILEAPHRLRETLSAIMAVMGDRRLAVCRELTKLHEEIFRGTVSEALDHFAEPRGEFTLVVAGREEVARPELTADIEAELARLRREGFSAKEATGRLAQETGLARKELYRAWLKLKSGKMEG